MTVNFQENCYNCVIYFEITKTSGQSYKASTIVNYDSRVVPDLKIAHITTLQS